MTEYLIFFNQQWVPDYTDEDFVQIGVESKALVAEMKDAGILVFAGGLEETPALASADATSGELVITDGPYAETKECVGGLTIVDVADDEAARMWAGRIAGACRWPQEVRAIKPGSIRGTGH